MEKMQFLLHIHMAALTLLLKEEQGSGGREREVGSVVLLYGNQLPLARVLPTSAQTRCSAPSQQRARRGCALFSEFMRNAKLFLFQVIF